MASELPFPNHEISRARNIFHMHGADSIGRHLCFNPSHYLICSINYLW
jgi:hypothetical protein